jgi:hypothetical protein
MQESIPLSVKKNISDCVGRQDESIGKPFDPPLFWRDNIFNRAENGSENSASEKHLKRTKKHYIFLFKRKLFIFDEIFYSYPVTQSL